MSTDRYKSTLPDSKRGSLAKLAKSILEFCLEHRLGERMQLLLYSVVEGHRGAALEQRLGVDLATAEQTFRTLTGQDVYVVAEKLLDGG